MRLTLDEILTQTHTEWNFFSSSISEVKWDVAMPKPSEGLGLSPSYWMTACSLFPASGHPHCFFCHLELGSDREVPSSFVRYVDVEFDMPTTSASKATVRSISVEDKTDVRKWVNYSAHYSYKVKLSSANVHGYFARFIVLKSMGRQIKYHGQKRWEFGTCQGVCSSYPCAAIDSWQISSGLSLSKDGINLLAVACGRACTRPAPGD